MYTKKHGINKNTNKNKNKYTKKHRYSNKNQKQKKTKNVIICYQSQVKNKIKGGAPTLSDLKDLIFNLEDIKELIQRYYVVVDDASLRIQEPAKTSSLQTYMIETYSAAIASLKTIKYTDIAQYSDIQKFLKRVKEDLIEEDYNIIKDSITNIQWNESEIEGKANEVINKIIEDYSKVKLKLELLTTDNIIGFIKLSNLSFQGKKAEKTKEKVVIIKKKVVNKWVNNEIFITDIAIKDEIDSIPTIIFFKDFFNEIKLLIESISDTNVMKDGGPDIIKYDISKSTVSSDMKRVFATEKMFNKVFPKDVADDLGIRDQLDKALKNKEISRDQYNAMIAAVDTPTKPFSTKITESALNVAKMIGSWKMPTFGTKVVDAVGKKNNKQVIKLLWFPRREYKKGQISTSDTNEYGQFMVLIEPEKYANSWEFMNQNYFGVEDLLTNIMDGCPGTKCSNGISRHRPYKEQVLDITNYQPEFDEIMKKEKEDKKEKEKNKDKSALTSENLTANQEQYKK